MTKHNPCLVQIIYGLFPLKHIKINHEASRMLLIILDDANQKCFDIMDLMKNRQNYVVKSSLFYIRNFMLNICLFVCLFDVVDTVKPNQISSNPFIKANMASIQNDIQISINVSVTFKVLNMNDNKL